MKITTDDGTIIGTVQEFYAAPRTATSHPDGVYELPLQPSAANYIPGKHSGTLSITRVLFSDELPTNPNPNRKQRRKRSRGK